MKMQCSENEVKYVKLIIIAILYSPEFQIVYNSYVSNEISYIQISFR